MPTFKREMDVGAKRPVTEDWSNDLDTGETIAAVTWTVPSGIELHDESFTDTTATAVLEATGGYGQYVAKCRITTNLGSPSHIDGRSILLTVVDR